MYIGNDLQIAHPSYKIIDDISSGFNGSTTSFALNVSGATPVPFPINTQQVMISVNGVIQEPDPSGSAGFKLLGSNIVFSSAPANGHAFFGVINAGADYVTAGSEFPDGSATAPSFTFQDDQDTGWFRSGSGAVGYSSNGVQTLTFDGNGLTVTGDTSFVGDSTKNLLWDKSAGQLEFADNAKATFGTGNDLEIFHNGTYSEIKNTTGGLYLENTSEIGFVSGTYASGEWILKGTPNASVELYYDNSKKLETMSNGVKFTGTLSADDDQSILLGTSQDFRIRHTGSHSEITDEGTGKLRLGSNQVDIKSAALDETMATFVDDGAVSLYYDNSKKFETHTSGVTVTGRVLATGTGGYGYLADDDVKIGIGTGKDLEIYHDGSHSYVKDTGTGNLILAGTQVNILNAAANESMIRAAENGAVDLYYDNAKKLETTSGGINVTGAINVNGTALSAAPEVSLVADGAIAANKPVAVQSDGKIKEIKEFAVSAALGSAAIIDSSQGNVSNIESVCHIGDGKFVVLWICDSDGDDLYASCGTVTGTTIGTMGTPVKVADTVSERVARVAYDSVSDAILMIYSNNGSTLMRAASISGTTISLGSEVTHGTDCQGVAVAGGNGGFMTCRQKSNDCEVKAVTVSGNTITAGNDTNSNLNSSCTENRDCVDLTYSSDDDKYVLMTIQASKDVMAHVIYRTGTVASIKSGTNMTNAAQGMGKVAYGPSGTVFHLFRDNHDVCGNIWTVSGDSLSQGTAQTLDTANPQTFDLTYNPEDGKGYGLIRDGSDGHKTSYMALTNNNGTIQGAAFVEVHNQECSELACSYLESGKIIYAYTASNVGTGKIQQVAFTDSTLSTGYIGFSSAAINDTATGTIGVVGNTNSSQSSLTAGKKYYVTRTGGLATQPATPSVEAGIALSSTKILIKG